MQKRGVPKNFVKNFCVRQGKQQKRTGRAKPAPVRGEKGSDHTRRQAAVLHRIRMGKTSSRPMTIQAVRASLLTGENRAKLPMGPTASRPGPMLLMQATTAVKVVPKEKFIEWVEQHTKDGGEM